MFDSITKIVIAAPDADAVVKRYTETFCGSLISQDDREQWGIKVTIMKVGNCIVEVMTPIAEGSIIDEFLQRNPEGGMTGVGVGTDNLEGFRDQAKASDLSFTGGEDEFMPMASDIREGFVLNKKSLFGVTLTVSREK
jgi:methylmalonyl-CoA/ethylmalonyl-CoA epimerase